MRLNLLLSYIEVYTLGSIVMDTSNNITETLQRTINMMQGELERSVLSTQMLGKPFNPTSCSVEE